MMAWRPHPKRAAVDPSNPRAWGTCDASGFIGNWVNLVPVYQWEGTQLVNQGVLVYPEFADVPQEQLRSIRLPPDPPPLLNARPEPYTLDEGAMPLTTESAYPGDPGQVLRDGQGNYIGVDTDAETVPSSEGSFVLDHSFLDSEDELGS